MQSNPWQPGRRLGVRLRGLGAIVFGAALVLAGAGLAVLLLRHAAQRSGPNPIGQATTLVTDPLARDTLQPADLGLGWRPSSAGATGSPSWPWDQSGACPGYRAADYPAQDHRLRARAVAFTDSVGNGVREVIEEYQPGWAGRSLADLQKVLTTCASYPGPGGTVTFRVVVDGLAGPDSRLIVGTIGAGATTYFLVVRDGSVLLTVQVPGALGEPYARQLAARLQQRISTAPST
jgi:hypothetical protein